MTNKTNVAVQVMNAIRNSASIDYRNYVPYAVNAQDSILKIGSIMRDYPFLYNEFIDIIGRFVRYEYNNRSIRNHLAFGKRGMLPYGKTIGEIFQGLAEPYQFDAKTNNLWNVVEPDIEAAYHVVNYDVMYQVDISPTALDSAFLSWDELYDFIERIIARMYDSAAYDEEQVMKYLIALNLINGSIATEKIAGTSTRVDSQSTVKVIKAVSNGMTFPKTQYNRAKVLNHCEKNEQYTIMTSAFDAATDVDVLARAFNMDKVEFEGHRVLIDSFDSLDQDRLAKLITDFTPIDAAALKNLAAVCAVTMSDKWYVVYDSAFDMDSQKISKRRSYQYTLHSRKLVSSSPFENCVAFTTATSDVESVTIIPTAATVKKGEGVQLTASVSQTGFGDNSVKWTTDDVNTTVTASGFVQTSSTSKASVTVTATSNANSTITKTATITVS